ncbi:TolB family protein [Bacteroidota bacterium]
MINGSKLSSILNFLLIMLLITCCSESGTTGPSDNNQPEITGAYLGQTPPGAAPQLFAPVVFTEANELHSNVVFSPYGQEVFWTLMDGYPSEILHMKLENGTWTAPATAPFNSQFGTLDPSFSPDGNRVFFMSWASASGNSAASKENIWFVEREGNGWGQPQMLGNEVNYLDVHWQVSVASNGTLYFAGSNGANTGGIWFSEFIDGQYTQAQFMGDAINTGSYEGTPFIAPDESYLMFSSHRGGNTNADLFISFKNEDGTWSQAQNMGSSINTAGHELYAIVSGNSEYLFFLSSRTGILRAYWMDAEIIETFR